MIPGGRNYPKARMESYQGGNRASIIRSLLGQNLVIDNEARAEAKRMLIASQAVAPPNFMEHARRLEMDPIYQQLAMDENDKTKMEIQGLNRNQENEFNVDHNGTPERFPILRQHLIEIQRHKIRNSLSLPLDEIPRRSWLYDTGAGYGGCDDCGGGLNYLKYNQMYNVARARDKHPRPLGRTTGYGLQKRVRL